MKTKIIIFLLLVLTVLTPSVNAEGQFIECDGFTSPAMVANTDHSGLSFDIFINHTAMSGNIAPFFTKSYADSQQWGLMFDSTENEVSVGVGSGDSGNYALSETAQWYKVEVNEYHDVSQAYIKIDSFDSTIDIDIQISTDNFGTSNQMLYGSSGSIVGIDNVYYTNWSSAIFTEEFEGFEIEEAIYSGGIIHNGSNIMPESDFSISEPTHEDLLPVIDSWSNDYTEDDTLIIYPNIEETVIFSTVYDPIATSYTWLYNGADQSNNDQNITMAFPVGNHTLITYGTTGAGNSANTTWQINVAPTTLTAYLTSITAVVTAISVIFSSVMSVFMEPPLVVFVGIVILAFLLGIINRYLKGKGK